MGEFPGFPCNDFDFHFEEAGGALAGLLMRDRSGNVIPGVLPNVETLLSAGSGWTVLVAPFVAARSKGRSVLLGGTTEQVVLDVDSAPSTNSRIDVIYALPADVGAGDPAQGVAVVTGTVSAVPAKPSIPDGAIELGTLRVSAGQSSAAAAVLTETFKFAALTGGSLYVRASSDLSSIDAIDGTRAYILTNGREAERVGGQWLQSKTAAYVSPFKAYSTDLSTVEVTVSGGMILVRGVATTTAPADIDGTTNQLVANIGAAHAPKGQLVQVMQGSGDNRWTMTVETDGRLHAARYGPNTPSGTVWLPFSVVYPIKRS